MSRSPSHQRRLALRLADAVAPTDVVVIGSGVAGLTAALALDPRRVTLLTKGALASGSSRWAQGGLAAAVGPDDAPARHADDTLAAGAGLVDEGLAQAVAGRAPAAVRRLIALGVRFDRDRQGRLALGREGAHGAPRILHAGGDATGAELVRALIARLVGEQRLCRRIAVIEHAFAEDLVTEDGRVVGVLARHRDGRVVLHRAAAVVLATGGCGQAWAKTTNPPEATGDGLAMAARAGAVLADLAFIQFHPTALDAAAPESAPAERPLPLLTEALRGAGALLVDRRERRFLSAVDPRAELAPRDLVARAIWQRVRGGEQVFLDARRAVGEAFPRRFPTVWAACRERGLDPRSELLPVTPAAHYAMAGVAVDARGRTSLAGLWAVGEVAASGLHGANRLASNSLLEGVVLGRRVAEDVARCAPAGGERPRHGLVVRPCRRATAGALTDAGRASVRAAVRERAWRDVGLERDRRGLEQALAALATHERDLPPEPTEPANLATVARLVAAAALEREESRGAHQRADHPDSRPDLARRSFWTYAPDLDGPPLEPAHPVGAPSQLREIA